MAQNKPSKPSVTLPNNFGGVKNEFSASKISNGYEASTPEIVEGGNLNYMLDGLFQNTKYMRTVLDYVRDTPTGKIFWTNTSGQMDYIQPAIIATNSEFNTGTATDKTPNVKQVVDKFATKSDDTSVVHKTGDETIAGNKTFSGNLIKQSNSLEYKGIHIQNTQLTKGSTPSSVAGGQFVFQDKDGLSLVDRIGGVEVTYDTNGEIITRILACQPVVNSTNYASISVIYPASGNPYTVCPTPTDTTTTSGTQIATTGWVNSIGNNAVHKTGDETIAGNKTFSGNVKLTAQSGSPQSGLFISSDYTTYAVSVQDTKITKGTAPSSNSYCGIDFYGTATTNYANRLGLLEFRYDTDKLTSASLCAFKSNTASDSVSARVAVHYPASGNPYTEAPASDVANSIVTTINKSKAANGYFQLGNGLIIQWGKTANLNNSASNPTSTTLPKAFTSTNYKVILTIDNGTTVNNEYGIYVTGKTTTAFSAVLRSYEGGSPNRPAAFIAIGY